MHEPLLAQAALPEPTVILGLLMRRYYSIGHELLLIRDSNPLVAGGKVRDDDVRRAVWTCASTWAECFNGHDHFLTPIKRALWRFRIRKASYPLAAEEFRKYRQS